MLKKKIFKNAPLFFQNGLISVFNLLAYKKRYGGNYKKYVQAYKDHRNLSLEELKKMQQQKCTHFIEYVCKHSVFYSDLYAAIKKPITLETLNSLPIVTKGQLQTHFNSIITVPLRSGVKSNTGGTTGKSLQVVFTKDNYQERFAILDTFRGQYGYVLGKRTAWFSGKNIVFDKDIKKHRFWKTDHLHNIRYYSTFHIKENYLSYYIDDLISYKPQFISGFPSTIVEIASYGLSKNISFPKNVIKAIFPTAETITSKNRTIIETFFKTKVYDQYASSEGAPFIFECVNQNLHVQLHTGVFEVLDSNDQPAQQGRLVVTSFTTYGTPLIRYDIGDVVVMSEKTCSCGDQNPIVENIMGRAGDFLFSPQHGKINLGNISNTLKGTRGIIKFQAIQNKLNTIEIFLIVDKTIFTEKSQQLFYKNWVDRVGDSMKLEYIYVNEIPLEKSGKFCLVKNNIKHLI